MAEVSLALDKESRNPEAKDPGDTHYQGSQVTGVEKNVPGRMSTCRRGAWIMPLNKASVPRKQCARGAVREAICSTEAMVSTWDFILSSMGSPWRFKQCYRSYLLKNAPLPAIWR